MGEFRSIEPFELLTLERPAEVSPPFGYSNPMRRSIGGWLESRSASFPS